MSYLVGTQHQLTYLSVKIPSFLLRKVSFSQGAIFLQNVLILFCVDFSWFYHYQSWSISIAKDHRYPKYIILCVVYFYSERLPLPKIYYFMCGLFISIAKDLSYSKYIILCEVYFYSERPPLSKIYYPTHGLFL